MRRCWTLPVLALCACFTAAAAADPTPGGSKPDDTFRFKFPDAWTKPLAPVARGGDKAAGTVLIVAPERTGRTTQAQPTVHFFFRGKARADLVVTMTADGEVKELLTHTLSDCGEGVHALKLADLDVSLKPGLKYQLVVAIRTDPDRALTRKDPHHITWISYQPPPPALAATLQRQTSKYERAKVYFEESIWCDGLACIYDVIQSKPQDAKQLRRQLIKVYEEVNLPEVAEFEAKLLEQ
jgi:hypothetical protein